MGEIIQLHQNRANVRQTNSSEWLELVEKGCFILDTTSDKPPIQAEIPARLEEIPLAADLPEHRKRLLNEITGIVFRQQ